LRAWKNNHVHIAIQAQGREKVFSDYRVRSGNEASDSGSDHSDNITTSAGKFLLLWQYPIPPDTKGPGLSHTSGMAAASLPNVWQNLVDAATYVNETHTLRISSWPTKDIGLTVKDSISRVEGDDVHLIRVARDYGKFQRKEARADAD
jgi:hypothetical protein